MTDPCFVFGSNLAGRHGKGAALWARHNRGAIYGQGVGPQGNSYAIPTRDDTPWPAKPRTLPLATVYKHCRDFLAYARAHDHRLFELTPIGCGHAGFTPAQIAPAFRDAPPNVLLPDVFKQILAMAD